MKLTKKQLKNIISESLLDWFSSDRKEPCSSSDRWPGMYKEFPSFSNLAANHKDRYEKLLLEHIFPYMYHVAHGIPHKTDTVYNTAKMKVQYKIIREHMCYSTWLGDYGIDKNDPGITFEEILQAVFTKDMGRGPRSTSHKRPMRFVDQEGYGPAIGTKKTPRDFMKEKPLVSSVRSLSNMFFAGELEFKLKSNNKVFEALARLEQYARH